MYYTVNVLFCKVVIIMVVSVNTLELLTSHNGAGMKDWIVPGQYTILRDSATQFYIFQSTIWISETASNVSKAVFILT